MGSDQIVPAQFPARVVFERRPTAFTPAKSEEIASIHARSRGFHTMTRILWAGESRTDGRQPVNWSRAPVSTLSIPDSIVTKRGQDTNHKTRVQVQRADPPTAALRNRDFRRERELSW
jgi:hypothetical protein